MKSGSTINGVHHRNTKRYALSLQEWRPDRPECLKAGQVPKELVLPTTINARYDRSKSMKNTFKQTIFALRPWYTYVWLLAILISCQGPDPTSHKEVLTQVCIYGATPAGISAAISAAKNDKRVLLIEPTPRIGGMLTSGLSHSDFYSFEALTGSFLEFSNRVLAYYSNEYGEHSEQAEMSFRGVFGEPKVNLRILKAMLAEYPSISILRNTVVDSVEKTTQRITSAAFHSGDDRINITANIYIDASYEGDLMALAGVPYAVGREGKEVYGEPLAPEKGDDQLQGYNFRFCATRVAENRAEVKPPKDYDREDFLGLLPLLDSGKIKNIFDDPKSCIFKAHNTPLPNYKYDVNDVSGGPVRLSLPGHNLGWPEGNQEERKRIFERHLYHNVGILYFLQNDPAVPLKFREQAREWGWCKDEFVDTDNLPPQLYVREARRMIGQYVYKQQDSEHAEGDARSVLHTNAIAIGDYWHNCHGTFHKGPIIGGSHSGEFYHPIPPYQIPYGVLVSKELANLLVPGAVSASHVGFCALRLEPIWMSLGQVSGQAASMAIDDDVQVQGVDIQKLQESLHKNRLATIYVSDVPPGHPDFEAVQWWGTSGGLHGMYPTSVRGQKGATLFGQFSEAAIDHDVQLDRELTGETQTRWLQHARSKGMDLKNLAGAQTRGEFIREAFKARRQPKQKKTEQ